jgi:hypothetical protein
MEAVCGRLIEGNKYSVSSIDLQSAALVPVSCEPRSSWDASFIIIQYHVNDDGNATCDIATASIVDLNGMRSSLYL